MIMAEERAVHLGLRPLARFVTLAAGGVPPELMGYRTDSRHTEGT